MKFPLALVCLLSAASLGAQPIVNQGGVLNSASFTRDGLPGDGLALGGMFAVFGSGMGPAALVQAPSIPLQTQLAGTSLEVSVGGVTVAPFLLFTSSGQLAAVLPSNTPLGSGSLTVTYNGQTSAPVTVKVVQSAFGIFARNQAGFGPAIIQNFISNSSVPLNALNQAAQPGQVVILWGTGLGPIQASDADLPPVADLPFEVDVLIGGTIVVKPLYAGRTAQFPGVDQVNFAVPPGIEGCFVSVAIRVDGVVSNYGTMAIASGGNYCNDPLSAGQVMQAEQAGHLRVGAVTLTAGDGVEQILEAEAGDYSLALLNSSILTFPALETHVTPIGSCIVWPAHDDFFPVDPTEPVELVGGDLTFMTAAGTLTEDDEIPEGFFGPGPVTITSTAGPDVGAFQIIDTLPAAGTLVAPLAPQRIDRTQDLTVRWNGVDAATDFVLILLRSLDQNQGVGRSAVCSAEASGGEFVVPASLLGSLPASVAAPGNDEPAGQFLVGSARKPSAGAVQASGVDVGLFVPIQLFGLAETSFE